MFGAPPQIPNAVKQLLKNRTLKTARKLVGGKEREKNVMGKGSGCIKSFCGTADKGYMGQDAHALQQDWGMHSGGV